MKGALLVAALLLLALLLVHAVLRRRGRVTATGTAPGTLTAGQAALRDELQSDIARLCALGPRNTRMPENLAAAADFIESSLAGHRVERQRYAADGIGVENLIVEIPGTTRAQEIVVVGAHYDSVGDSPGADDNASGVAALLALARIFARATPSRTLRFVAWTNEEPPHFQTATMGSLVYAKRCRQRNERIVAAISLEMLGYFDERPGSQQYPPPLSAMYPDRGTFVGFVGNLASRPLVTQCVKAFRARTAFPAESAVLPEMIPQTGWSDQWSFWQFGWPALMVTDTALYRNPNYHLATDTPDTLDYTRMAQVVDGLASVVEALTGPA